MAAQKVYLLFFVLNLLFFLFLCSFFFWTFSLPSRRWILKSLCFLRIKRKWCYLTFWLRRHVDPHAWWKSKRTLSAVSFYSQRSVQPGETTAAGQSRLGGHHESVTDISHRRMLTKILTARPPEMWPFSKLSHEETRILQVLACFQDV